MEHATEWSLALPQVRIAAVRKTVAQSVSPRLPQNHRLCIVLHNCGYLLYRDTEIKLSQGDVFALFPGIPYAYRSDAAQPWELLTLELEGSQCPHVFASFGASPERPFVFGQFSEETDRHVQRLQRAFQEGELCFPAMAECWQLLALLERQGQSGRPEPEAQLDPVEQAVKYIKENYHIHIDVDMVCSYVGYSRSYFSRTFKAQTGMAISEYINHTRIQRAKYLLCNTQLFVSEISKIVGFSDPFYFSKSFKKYTGRSPTEYVERNRDKLPKKGEPT